MNIRDRKHRWVRRARWLVGFELALSTIFNLTMIGAVKQDQMLNLLLIVVITVNIMTAARLFLKLRGIKCASSIMAYVVWKIVQEVVIIPALVIFTFVLVDQYLSSWNSATRGVQILVVVWTYAIYSLLLIIFLAWLARFLWQLQVNQCISDKNDNNTTISYIDGFHDDLDHRQLLVESSNVSRAMSNEGLELKEMNNVYGDGRHLQNRPFVPYDHVIPYISG
uniref:Uncharacterized protein n=1 Tax=Caenorhabditis japonica TaxID=281687 RepID=A0A8R1E048_CAEJA